MHTLGAIALSLIDPRGRSNRCGLRVAASILLAIEIALVVVLWATGATFDGALALVVKLVLLWLAIAACARRLHDLGRSAWSLAWAVPATIVWATAAALAVVAFAGLEALSPSSPWYMLAIGVSMVPVIVGTLWLHLARGQTGPNRYGPEPDGLGVSTFSGLMRSRGGDGARASAAV
jgi:uncharacterized membrane protein YhaH (DUF805 family)